MATELQLDHLFWKAISSNLDFQSWFLKRTKFSAHALKLVTDETWHQRWFKDPDTKKDSETDTTLIFEDSTNADRYAIHVENKPPHGKFESRQPENYRIRAMNRMLKWKHIDFQTALIAPLLFFAKWPSEVEHFDIRIAYEDISEFVPEFGLCLRNTGPQ
jgi:hypothetical protein